jgi:hypothetical protein
MVIPRGWRPASGPGAAARAESGPAGRSAAPLSAAATGRGLRPPPRSPAGRLCSSGPHGDRDQKCEHGDRWSGGGLRAGAAGAGGCAWSRWPAAGPLAVLSARVRRARPCRGRSPACLVFSGRWPMEGEAVTRGRGPGARGGGGRWPARGALSSGGHDVCRSPGSAAR